MYVYQNIIYILLTNYSKLVYTQATLPSSTLSDISLRTQNHLPARKSMLLYSQHNQLEKYACTQCQ